MITPIMNQEQTTASLARQEVDKLLNINTLLNFGGCSIVDAERLVLSQLDSIFCSNQDVDLPSFYEVTKRLIQEDNQFTNSGKEIITDSINKHKTSFDVATQLAVYILEFHAQQIGTDSRLPATSLTDFCSRAFKFIADNSAYDPLAFLNRVILMAAKDIRFTQNDKTSILHFAFDLVPRKTLIWINLVNKSTEESKQVWIYAAARFKIGLKDIPELSTPRTHRYYLNDKLLLFSDCANKTFAELGFQEGVTLMIEEIAPQAESASTGSDQSEEPQELAASKDGKVKFPPKTPSRSNRTGVNEPSLMTTKEYQEQHSIKFTKVLEEAEPIFKENRHKLNVGALQRSPPKKRTAEPKQMFSDLVTAISGLELETNDVKTKYPVLIGDPSKHHCSRKKGTGKPVTEIDLHGLSRAEALELLDSLLPKLVEKAMVDEPWVIPVNIVCGRGKQVLSEAVKEWIEKNYQVGNRPKSFDA
jgi:DNA-nicking Smr family endonuclease